MQRNQQWIAKTLHENGDVLEKFVAPEKLQASLDQFRQGGMPDHSFLFRVLAFSSWLKIFNVSLAQLTVVCLQLSTTE